MFNKYKEKILCISPAHNESDFLKELIASLNNYCFKILIIDDGSTDNTSKVLEKEDILLIRNEESIGKAASIVKAYEFLLRESTGCDYVLIIDSDLQHDPKEIPKLFDELVKKKKDVVIGARDLGSLEMPPVRRTWNKFISFILKFLFDVKISDSQSGYRLFTEKSFKQVFSLVKTNGYLLETEVDLIIKKLNLSYSEVKIKTIYQKAKLRRDSTFLLFIRMVQIVSHVVFAILSKIFSPYRISVIYTISFFVVVGSLYSFYLKQKPIFNLDSQTEYARKYVEATTWIRNNTPEDSIILTEWTEGHQVVLLANRKVVATTKVYPSEAKEIAGRYADLAMFFYSNDENIIKNVLNKHNVRYIFVRKDFNYRSACKSIMECDNNNDFLVALISGKVSSFPFIKRVYKNSKILIYKYQK